MSGAGLARRRAVARGQRARLHAKQRHLVLHGFAQARGRAGLGPHAGGQQHVVDDRRADGGVQLAVEGFDHRIWRLCRHHQPVPRREHDGVAQLGQRGHLRQACAARAGRNCQRHHAVLSQQRLQLGQVDEHQVLLPGQQRLDRRRLALKVVHLHVDIRQLPQLRQRAVRGAVLAKTRGAQRAVLLARGAQHLRQRAHTGARVRDQSQLGARDQADRPEVVERLITHGRRGHRRAHEHVGHQQRRAPIRRRGGHGLRHAGQRLVRARLHRHLVAQADRHLRRHHAAQVVRGAAGAVRRVNDHRPARPGRIGGPCAARKQRRAGQQSMAARPARDGGSRGHRGEFR